VASTVLHFRAAFVSLKAFCRIPTFYAFFTPSPNFRIAVLRGCILACAQRFRRFAMSLILLLLSVLVMIYLIVALLRPEKF